MKKIFTGPYTNNKIRSLFDSVNLREKIEIQHDTLLIVVPNKRYKTLLERHIFDYLDNTGYFHPNMITIDELWLSLIHENFPNLLFEKKWQRELFVSKVLEANKSYLLESELTSWISMLDKSIVFWEQRLPITEDNYYMNDWFGEISSQRLSWFVRFYQQYVELSEANHLISRERIRKFLPEKTAYFNSFSTILFLSLDEWLVEHWHYLISQTSSIENVIFNLDTYSESILPYQADVISKLLSVGFEKIENNLTISEQRKTYFYSGQNRVDEVTHIAQQIKYFHKQNIPFHSMCMVLKQPDNYLPWIQKIFNEQEIRFNYSAGLPANSTALTELNSTFIDILSGNLSAHILIKYCSNSVVGLKYLTRPIELISSYYGYFSTFKEWEVIEEKIQIILNSENQALLRNYPLAKFQKSLNVLFNVVHSIYTNYVRFQTAKNNSDRSTILKSWLMGHISYKKLQNHDIINFSSWTVLQNYLNMLDTVGEFNPNHIELSSGDYLHILKQHLGRLTWNEPVREGVQILGPLEVKGTDYDVVFIPGLHSKIYPEKKSDHLFFSKKEIAYFNEHVGLTNQILEYHEFIQLINKPNKVLYGTYSSTSEYREENPSLYFQLLIKDVSIEKCETNHSNDLRSFLLNNKKWDLSFHNHRISYLKHIKQFGEMTEYDGVLKNQDAIKVVRQYYENKKRKISSTDFDKFAECGFLFLGERLLGITKDEEYTFDFDNKTKGNILHQIVFRFYTEHSINLLSYDFEKAWSELVLITNQVVAEFSQTDNQTFMKQQLLSRLTDRHISPLFSFLKLEYRLREQLINKFAEYSFGDDDHSKLPINTQYGQFYLHGRIDRIDQIKDSNEYILFDYKSSEKKDTGKLIEAGKSFQFLAYAFAVSQLLGSVGGTFYYSLKKLYSKELEHLSDFWGSKEIYKTIRTRGRMGWERNDFDKWVSNIPNLLGDQINTMLSGIMLLNKTAYHHSKGFECSSFCSLIDVCRKDEQRIEYLFPKDVEGDEE